MSRLPNLKLLSVSGSLHCGDGELLIITLGTEYME